MPSVDEVSAARLIAVARASIEHGVHCGGPLAVDPEAHPPALRASVASFVTLRRAGELRGCTGSLEARRPLVVDVARNAHRSAFADSRFPPLEERELIDLAIHISLLGPLEALEADDEAALLAALRPGIDGLVLREGLVQSTFLPAVWSSLPEPALFVAELKRKAGLPADHWSETLRFERYSVDEIG